MIAQVPDRLRIAIFTYSTKPRGGVIHTLSLAEHLQALGHDVHIFALGKDQKSFFRPTSVPFTIIPFGVLADDVEMDERILRYIQTYYEHMVAHQSEPFDIYHVQDCVSANAIWRVREDGIINSFVRTIHHIDDFVSPSLIECQNNSVYRPDHRIVVSKVWQQQLQSDFGVASEVIYNGVDLKRYRPPTADQRAAARAQIGLQDEFAFLHIGGIEPRKNTIRLLHAFGRVKPILERQGRNCTMLLVGGETLLDYTPYRTEFLAILAQSGLEEKDVRQLGVAADDQIPLIYHAADALTFPSVKEGWGLVVLEALASHLPVLTSDLPVFHEYLRHKENALLVDPSSVESIANGMVRLVEDSGLRQRLARAGLATAKNFSWEATANAHVAWYRTWLAQNH